MHHLKAAFYYLIFFVLISTLVGCGAVEDSEPLDIQAQSVPTVTPTTMPTPTPTVRPTSTPQPTTPSLKTELIEPISPVSPITVTKGLTMTLADNSATPVPGSEELVTAAVTDLAERTGATPDQITLVSVEFMDWSDSSLGCPQEGFMYAQVITPGYLIILETNGEQYPYHTDLTGNIVLCEE